MISCFSFLLDALVLFQLVLDEPIFAVQVINTDAVIVHVIVNFQEFVRCVGHVVLVVDVLDFGDFVGLGVLYDILGMLD